MVIGAVFMFLAAVGIVRQPDVYLRMSSTSKATTLGIGSMLLAAAFYFGEFSITARAVAAIAFIMVSAPVSSHVLGSAAYFSGAPLWEGTLTDELRGHYDLRTQELESVSFPELDVHLPDIEVRKFRLPETSSLVNRTLADIDLRRKYDITLLAIRRGQNVISNPGGDMLIMGGDELVIMGSPDRLKEVRNALHRARQAAAHTKDQTSL